MPNPIIDGVTIGSTTYDLKDPNLTDEVSDLKSALTHFGGGTTGQILRKKTGADFDTEWTNAGTPTDLQVKSAVDDWLDDHPEATTTVDFSVTVKVFPTVAYMIADDTLKIGDNVATRGYYESGDNGGTKYVVSSTQSGVFSIALENGLYANMLPENGVVYAKQFGIKDGDDCGALFSSLCTNDNLQHIVFDGNFICSTTISVSNNVQDRGNGSYARKQNPVNPKVYDFTGCTITLMENCNLFSFLGYDIDFIGGIFKVDNSVVFTNSIIYFGSGYHSNIKIKGCQMIGNTRYSATSSTLENSDFENCPVVGCGIKLHGTDVSSTRNATYFCEFKGLTVESFDIGVLVYIDKAQSSTFVSWINTCEFDCLFNYTGKGYVVVGNKKVDTAAYPRRMTIAGQYQSHGNHDLSYDKYGNILISCDEIIVDIKTHDDNRYMMNNLGGRVILNDKNFRRKDIYGLRTPEYSNDVGHFGSSDALTFVRNFSLSTDKSYTNYCVPRTIESNHLIHHITHKDGDILAYYIEYGGVPFFAVGKKNIKIEFDYKFTTEDTLPANTRIGFFANLFQREHERIGTFRTPNMIAKSLTKRFTVVGIENNVITLSEAITWDTSKTYYCIFEGKEYDGGFYNNETYPYIEGVSDIPKVTAIGNVVIGTEGSVTSDKITLDTVSGYNILINQGITICTYNSNLVVKATPDNLLGIRLPLGASTTATPNTYAHAAFTMETEIMAPSQLFEALLIPYCSADMYGYNYDLYIKDFKMLIDYEIINIDVLSFTEGTASPTTIGGTTARTFTPETYIIGMTYSNVYRATYGDYVKNPSVSASGVSFTSGAAAGYGIMFALKNASAGKSYSVSVTAPTGYVHMMFYDANGAYLSSVNAKNVTVTIPEGVANTLLSFTGSAADSDFTFTDIVVKEV